MSGATVCGGYLTKYENNMEPTDIIKFVSNYFLEDYERVIGTCQKKELVKVRHISMVLIKEIHKCTYEKAGSFFVGRTKCKDHCTVLHAIKSVSDQRETDESYDNDYRTIEKIISSRINNAKVERGPSAGDIRKVLQKKTGANVLSVKEVSKLLRILQPKKVALTWNQRQTAIRQNKAVLRRLVVPVRKTTPVTVKVSEMPFRIVNRRYVNESPLSGAYMGYNHY